MYLIAISVSVLLCLQQHVVADEESHAVLMFARTRNQVVVECETTTSCCKKALQVQNREYQGWGLVSYAQYSVETADRLLRIGGPVEFTCPAAKKLGADLLSGSWQLLCRDVPLIVNHPDHTNLVGFRSHNIEAYCVPHDPFRMGVEVLATKCTDYYAAAEVRSGHSLVIWITPEQAEPLNWLERKRATWVSVSSIGLPIEHSQYMKGYRIKTFVYDTPELLGSAFRICAQNSEWMLIPGTFKIVRNPIILHAAMVKKY